MEHIQPPAQPDGSTAPPTAPTRIRTATRSVLVGQHARLLASPTVTRVERDCLLLAYVAGWLRASVRSETATDADLAETLRGIVDALDETDAAEAAALATERLRTAVAARGNRLRRDVLSYLRDSGLSSAEYVTSWYADGVWAGSPCGCPDDRCIGHHHAVVAECQCLRFHVAEVLAARKLAALTAQRLAGGAS